MAFPRVTVSHCAAKRFLPRRPTREHFTAPCRRSCSNRHLIGLSQHVSSPPPARRGDALVIMQFEGKKMSTTLTKLATGGGLFACLAAFAAPAQAVDVSLARLDCGTPQAPTAVNQ